MEKQGENKARIIRADHETYEKFKSIASDEFDNQGQCLSTLINLYELEQGKAKIVERKLEIESFQSNINKINELFLMSLQLNQEAEERVRSELEKLLESKDKQIISLQQKVESVSKANEELKEESKKIKEDNTRHHYGEIKAGGSMVVIHPSIHPLTLKQYEVFNISEIKYISLELLKEIPRAFNIRWN
jgi:hypothetical protein